MEYEEKTEDLEQYDSWGECLEKVGNEYVTHIGRFVLDFSELEHTLNNSLAEILHNSSHELGYVIIEKLTIHNKIELFHKLYLRIVSFQNDEGKNALAHVKETFNDLNKFRNMIVHANWVTLDEDAYVRTKIKLDSEDGYVKFRMVKITPELIQERCKEKIIRNASSFFRKSAFI